MPSLDLLMSFFIATAIFAYISGPAMLYATAQTLGGGKRAGWMAALGIHSGGGFLVGLGIKLAISR